MSPLPLHDSRLKRAGDVRVGMQHTAADDAEAEGARTNLHNKANQRAKVYGLICAAGSDGRTGAELSEIAEIPRHVLSARLKELEDDNLIFRNGERRLAPSGVRNSVYVRIPETTVVPPEGRLL